jgi:hypothetical protein
VAVTFRVPPEAGAATALILGEFTEWSAVPMTPGDDGSHEVTIELPMGSSYRFRYLLDGARWANDWAADDYVANTYGSDDSVVIVATVDTDAAPSATTGPATSPATSPAKAKPAAKSSAKTTTKTAAKKTAKKTANTTKATTKSNAKTKKADAGAEPAATRSAAEKATGTNSPRPATRLR